MKIATINITKRNQESFQKILVVEMEIGTMNITKRNQESFQKILEVDYLPILVYLVSYGILCLLETLNKFDANRFNVNCSFSLVYSEQLSKQAELTIPVN